MKNSKLKTETLKLNHELKQPKSPSNMGSDFMTNDEHEEVFSDIANDEGMSDEEVIKDLTVHVSANKCPKIRQYALQPNANSNANQLNIFHGGGERHRSPEFTVSNSSALYCSHHHPMEETEGNETVHVTMPNFSIYNDIDDDDVVTNDGELSISAQAKSAQSFKYHHHHQHLHAGKGFHVKLDIPATVDELIENDGMEHSLRYASSSSNMCTCSSSESDDEESSINLTAHDELKTALPPPPTRKVLTDDVKLETPIAPTIDAHKILHSLQKCVAPNVDTVKIKKNISADLVSPKQTKAHWM